MIDNEAQGSHLIPDPVTHFIWRLQGCALVSPGAHCHHSLGEQHLPGRDKRASITRREKWFKPRLHPLSSPRRDSCPQLLLKRILLWPLQEAFLCLWHSHQRPVASLQLYRTSVPNCIFSMWLGRLVPQSGLQGDYSSHTLAAHGWDRFRCIRMLPVVALELLPAS